MSGYNCANHNTLDQVSCQHPHCRYNHLRRGIQWHLDWLSRWGWNGIDCHWVLMSPPLKRLSNDPPPSLPSHICFRVFSGTSTTGVIKPDTKAATSWDGRAEVTTNLVSFLLHTKVIIARYWCVKWKFVKNEKTQYSCRKEMLWIQTLAQRRPENRLAFQTLYHLLNSLLNSVTGR